MALLCALFCCTGARAEVLASGVTEAVSDVAISVMAPGRVEKVTVKEGQRVEKGQLLLYLDREIEALEVKRREITLADVARLNELREREAVLREQVALARELMRSGGVTRKQVEDEALALSGVVAEHEALEFAKKRERVELDLAKENYERRHLYAPMSGIVTKILVRQGESVEANAPSIRLIDVSRIRFVGTFSAASGVEPRVGAKVSLRLGHGPQKQTRIATITFVSPAVDAASGLIELVAEVDNRERPVRPGAIGQLVLQGD